MSNMISAQKQTYLLLAYGQKDLNGVCGEKIIFKQDEVSLLPAEVYTYRSKLLTELRTTYNKGYKNFYVDLVPSGKAVIFYEFETVFTKQKDGYDCTTSFYGTVTAKDMLAAEKAFTDLQTQYKKSTYHEVRRWGKQANLTPAAAGENDIDVKWTTSTKAYLLNMTNTRKDIALKVTIVSYKRKAGIEVQPGSETDLSKMTQSDITIVILEPGGKSQNSFPKADGFEIRISPKTATPAEEKNSKDFNREIIRKFWTCPNHNCDVQPISNVGVRG